MMVASIVIELEASNAAAEKANSLDFIRLPEKRQFTSVADRRWRLFEVSFTLCWFRDMCWIEDNASDKVYLVGG